jgi:glycosidase
MKKIFFGFLLAIIISTGSSFTQNKFPDWAKGIVWYQIFPERFADGDTSNEPSADKVFIDMKFKPKDWRVTKWTSNWFAQSGWEKRMGGGFRNHLYERRYGGDLQGIIDHLDYLKKLGVGAIYLNPVFDAPSLLKYDADTFHHIDVNFGPDPGGDEKLIARETPDDPKTWVWTSADSLFLKLIDEVHKRGMKIIIDGVFNHTGTHFWAFEDILKNGEKSKYKDWYEITSFGDSTGKGFDYKGWYGVKELPVFNRTEDDLNPGPKQYIFNITVRWMDPNNDGDPSDGVDGWRLDAAEQVPLGFWKGWSRLVTSINPKAFITGELWGYYPDFVSKNGPFNSLMDYNFAFAVNKFFVAKKDRISVFDFINLLQKIEDTYPRQNLDILQNLVDSHDTDRLSSMIANPDRGFDRNGNEDNPNYNPGKPDSADYHMQKIIAAFQITFKGAPMIYYGDEVGMWGADDPHDRKPMLWQNLKYDNEVITKESGFKKGFGSYKVAPDTNLLNYYKKIISIRNGSNALKFGDIKFIYSNDEKSSFAFERVYENERMICAFNIGGKADSYEVPAGFNKASYDELLAGETGNIKGSAGETARLIINIPPGSARIYKIYPLR